MISTCCEASVTPRRHWFRRWWLCTACGRKCRVTSTNPGTT